MPLSGLDILARGRGAGKLVVAGVGEQGGIGRIQMGLAWAEDTAASKTSSSSFSDSGPPSEAEDPST